MEIRTEQQESLTPSIQGDSDPKQVRVRVFYFGDAYTSPFDLQTIQAHHRESGITVPQVVPFSSFQRLEQPLSTDDDNPSLEAFKSRMEQKFGGEDCFFENFFQVECGYKHTLLLNKQGQVFVFGNGLQGQLGLGLGNRPLHLSQPQQIWFKHPKRPQLNEPISRISASAHNSAAFNESNKVFMWGSSTFHKLGLTHNQNTVDEPRQMEWLTEQVGFVTETGKTAVRSQLTLIESSRQRALETKRVSQIREVTFGESHSVMLDTKGNLYSLGASTKGRLGLSDRNLPTVIKQPTQITIGLPKPSFHSKIIHVAAGVSHTVALTRAGDLFSWGEGANQRLGLGFIEDSQSTPNQETPYQIQNVFDNKAVVSLSCGRQQSGVAMQSGTVYVWGKGSHEKNRQDDYIQCSTPYPLMEQKQIIHLAFGKDHMMAIDRLYKLYGWGEGTLGCLGFGDVRRKMMPMIVPSFEGKRVIDVACGENFTVVIAEVPKDCQSSAHEPTSGPLKEKLVQSNRKPLCGGNDISVTVRDKVLSIIKKKKLRSLSQFDLANSTILIDQSSEFMLHHPVVQHEVSVTSQSQSNSLTKQNSQETFLPSIQPNIQHLQSPAKTHRRQVSLTDETQK